VTAPYYQDDLVTLYHGRCEDVLPNLELSGSVHLLTDPPYFAVKDDEWDNQWSNAPEFLDWMGEWLDLAKPLISPNGSVWVFASPQLTSAVESIVASRFRVLNSVRWVKESHRGLKAELASLRRFWPAWEGIVFAEQFGADGSALKGSGWNDATAKLRAGVFEPLRAYLAAERDAAGVTNRQVDRYLGTAGMAGHYFGASQWALPTEPVYEKLRELFNANSGGEYLRREYEDLRREYEDLRREYEDLRREYEDLRRPFNLTDRKAFTDVWTFPNVAPYPGKHPCEKPRGLLAHMIETTTRPGDTILDCFTGSGAVLDIARQLGRRAVGIEMDEHWCKQAAKRLAQQPLRLYPAHEEQRSSGWSGTEQKLEGLGA
jgi:adenine-specific DNA-methyltransferase